jgi:2,4-dienoyl-CoA reductase-like NADH-dependent reductase (Old Yellow Enzyme family)
VRLIVEVFKAVRATVGKHVPVGVRISQGKVNDFDHKWAGEERDAEVIFGTLADLGADFIHVTEHESWKPAFTGTAASLRRLAKRFAPSAVIVANGGLHAADQAVLALDDGADIIATGKGALANPDLPVRFSKGVPLRNFDHSLLGPFANIKDSELAM